MPRSTSHKYRNSPIVEAVCEFRFAAESRYDVLIYGLVFDKVKSRYPNRRTRQQISLESEVGEGHVQQRIGNPVTTIQFVSEDEKSLIQIDPDKVSFIRRSPYVSWEDFRQEIRRGIQNYSSVVSGRKLERIGLRYINRIELPEREVKLTDYLKAVPRIPDPQAPAVIRTWAQRQEIVYTENSAVMTVQAGSINDEEIDGAAFLLDFDYATAEIIPSFDSVNGLIEWLDIAHACIEIMFEASLTDTTRQLFD